MAETLYQRLGGAGRIAAIVEDAVDRHAVNPVLAARFRGKDLPRLARLGTDVLCSGAGGPQQHERREPRATHAGMNVDEREVRATIDDIVAALRAHGVGPYEVSEVVAILHSMKRDVLRV